MRYWTWSEIKAKIEAECDTEDEDFVRGPELLTYANEAIDEAEAEIHGLYEDYFLKPTDISVQAGDEFISMSTHLPDIYADKIRRIIFSQAGSTTNYPVTRIKDWHKFEQKAISDSQVTTDLYQYFPINSTPGDPQIMLVPKIRESGTLKVWYLRNANRLYTDTDICDIPEFVNFVIAFMKVKIYQKEGNPGLDEATQKLEQQRQQMISSLQSRIPDADNTLEMDTSYYEDHN